MADNALLEVSDFHACERRLRAIMDASRMFVRAVLFVLTTCSACVGAFRVEQIIQVPLQRGQSVNALAADHDGNLIVTGSNVQGGFISKLDSLGTVILSFANFGAYSTGAAVAMNGDIYWIGSGGAPGFPFPFTKKVLPVAQLGSAVPGFLVKFRGTDGSIVWAAEIDALQPEAIALDASGFITLTGVATTAPGFATAGAYQSPAAGTVRPLGIARLTSDGDAVFMATYGGHSINGTSTCVSGLFFRCLSDPRTTAASLLLDSRGHIWIAGSTNETDLPVSPNALKSACGCSLSSGDGYLAEFSADGSSLLYATYLGTSTQSAADASGNDTVFAATMSTSGHIWLAGATNGTDLPVTSDAVQSTLMGDQDGFVMEYDPAANRLVYSTYYGTQGTNSITRVAIGTDGRPVLAGVLKSDSYDPYSFGNDFVAILNPSGIEATEFLRNGTDAGIAFSPSGALVVAGSGSVIVAIRESSATSPSIFGVANSASMTANGQVSPGEIISITGVGLGPTIPVAARLIGGQQTIASQLGGVQVFFDGVAAPLLYASSTQINAIVPFGTAGRQETRMVISNVGLTSNEARLGVVSAIPAIFLTQAVYQHLPVAAALNEDGTINSPINRAAPGSIVSIFGTGFGALAPLPPDGTLLSKSLPALQEDINVFGPGFIEVLYGGPAPGQVAGAIQINFRLPDNLTATPTILLFAGGWPAAYFTVWVSNT
jgi:uncharacterized protein (TIGR03437 family)